MDAVIDLLFAIFCGVFAILILIGCVAEAFTGVLGTVLLVLAYLLTALGLVIGVVSYIKSKK